MSRTANTLIRASQKLARELNALKFPAPVAFVYNPLDYAWAPHREYLERFANGPKRVLFLGMNPGPFGMAQTGVPFGEIAAVRDWLGITAAVGKPSNEHPARPVEGFACARSEVSGRRLWGLFARRFPRAEDFFAEHFVVNYCPLVFMEAGGRNRTPDKLPAPEQAALCRLCDTHLRAVVAALQPEWLIGVGGFAEKRFREAVGGAGFKLGTILHPSPASPAANRGWDTAVERQLQTLGIW